MKKLLIATLFLFTGYAQADYLTAAYVDSDLEVDAPFNQLFDDDANGFLIGYGWDTLHPWLAVEITYTDFGDSNNGAGYVENGYSESVNFQYEGQALDLWLVGRFSPFEITKDRPLYIVPRLGFAVAQSQGTFSYNYTTPTSSYSYSESDSDAGVGYAYGIGVEVMATQNLGVFVDWRKHEVDMVYLGQKVDFDPSSVQLGLNWHF